MNVNIQFNSNEINSSFNSKSKLFFSDDNYIILLVDKIHRDY
jgi:hypothetical protein